ncbi:MAG: LLM class flavin-dependent oxidoreductase [Streptosporangiaceae bacterium]
MALAAVACATSRVRIGALVTPLSRRRVHKVARETATLDLLSSGRLVFGAGLGSARKQRTGAVRGGDLTGAFADHVGTDGAPAGRAVARPTRCWVRAGHRPWGLSWAGARSGCTAWAAPTPRRAPWPGRWRPSRR